MISDDDAAAPRESAARPRLVRRVLLVVIGAFVLGYAGAALWMRAGASGQMVATVPNLHELSLADARDAAESADLIVEATDSLPHAEVARGHVLTQSPLPGQEVAPRSAIQVIVSSGPARHAIPRVEGLSREQAEQVLLATGLQPVVDGINDSRRAGLVVATEPAAGTMVEVPAQVRLQVSLGPPMVGVPELIGLVQDSVVRVLEEAQLALGEVSVELRFMGMEGEVLAQEPAAGDSILAGSEVNITVSTTRLELIRPEDRRRDPWDASDDRRRRRER